MTNVSVSPNSLSAQPDERVFPNLFVARDEVCNGLCRMQGLLSDLRGDLSAAHALGYALSEGDVQVAEVGLAHCIDRALATLTRLGEEVERASDAAVVARGNDSTRLSRKALHYRSGPHREDYSKGIDAEPAHD